MTDFTVDRDRWALVNAETGRVALVGARSLVEDQAAALDGYEARPEEVTP